MTFEERLLCLIFGNIGDKVALKIYVRSMM